VRGDDGSITVLALGLTGALLTAVAVVVDVSATVLAQRAVASAADGAASAAAQEYDEDAVLAGGLTGEVPLDGLQVRRVVEAYERAAEQAQPGLDLDARTLGTRATVTATRTIRLPFLGPLTGREVRVRAVTTVVSAVQP
jgi:hypothetical protein